MERNISLMLRTRIFWILVLLSLNSNSVEVLADEEIAQVIQDYLHLKLSTTQRIYIEIPELLVKWWVLSSVKDLFIIPYMPQLEMFV